MSLQGRTLAKFVINVVLGLIFLRISTTCECGEIIGSPMIHKDGRLAFHLIRGKFKRGLNKSKEYS
jgi:hypothetical protein